MGWNVLVSCRVFDSVGAHAIQMLRDAGCTVKVADPLGPFTAAQLPALLLGFDAVICDPDGYNAAVLRSPEAASLKIISRWGVGYDSIDIATATTQGIVVAFTPGMLDNAVADWTVAALLGVARRVAWGYEAVREGRWKSGWGNDVFGKTLGLIGCGRIGRAVARRVSGFDMKILAFDPNPIQAPGIEQVGLDELLQRSDFVSLHVALTPATRGLIGRDQLRRMKPSAYLINTARGPVIDETALVEALHQGWIAGAALDVFSTEPLPADHPLRTAPNALLTPHQAAFARDTGESLSNATAQAIIDLSQGKRPSMVVNPEVFATPALRATIS